MRKSSFYSKIFAAFLGLAVVPLVLHVLYFYAGLRNAESSLRDKAAQAMDRQASFMLRQVAQRGADRISELLSSAVSDTATLSLVEPSASSYINFFNNHKGIVWSMHHGHETKWNIPAYKEIAFIGTDGMEKLRISEGAVSSDLRDVNSKDYVRLNGDYFSKIMKTPADDIYVSHLEGRHVVNGVYSEVYLFGCKVVKNGRVLGVLVLSLDQKLMDEVVRHIYPTGSQVPVPPYTSGSYAFMFDDEGWVTAHPRPQDVRGYDDDGTLKAPDKVKNGRELMREGKRPFNLLYAGYIHPNYPAMAHSVIAGKSGVLSVTNVKGVNKLMAYVPVPFNKGEYSKTGIFCGVAVGAEPELFHKAAKVTSDNIQFEFRNYIDRSWAFVSLVLLIVIYVGYRLAVSVVRPIRLLAVATERMSTGRLDTEVEVVRDDEIGQLARSFNSMGRKLLEQREYLESSLNQLERSQQDLLWEQVFKTTVFENINTGIVTVNEYGIVTFMNSAAKDIFKIVLWEGEITLSELTKRFSNLDAEVEKLTNTVSDSRVKKYADVESAEGDKRYVVSVAPLFVGSYSGRVITIEDVTERAQMRSQMERMERLASLGRLSAGLAHEIRNPLTGVSILLDDLHDRLLDKPGEQELIRRSLSEIERLETLVNELLSFARVTEPVMADGNVADVLDEILFMMSPQCERASVRIVRDFDDDLRDFPMDAAKLKQAFINLIKNAVEAMPDGGFLTVTAKNSGSVVRVSIKDTGDGISADKLQLVFEPFYTSKGDGTGLGLAITHNIISDHKAEIHVKSEQGKGTEFIIDFPLK